MLGLPHLVGVTDTVRSAEEPHANAVNEINKIQQSQIAMQSVAIEVIEVQLGMVTYQFLATLVSVEGSVEGVLYE